MEKSKYEDNHDSHSKTGSKVPYIYLEMYQSNSDDYHEWLDGNMTIMTL